MKYITLVLSVIVFVLLSVSVHAAIQYYGINVELNEAGKANTKLIITFDKPTERFKLNIVGKVENFQATSIAGPVTCTQTVSGITYIDCIMNLTKEKRTVDFTFSTNDFVKILEQKSYFDVDFSPNEEVNEVLASVKLPEGTIPSNETVYPKNPRIDVIGKSIIVIWKMANVTTETPLRFQILYEQIQPTSIISVRLRYFVYLGIGAAAIIGYVVFRYIRKSEKLVLSVLDEFERKVVDVIIASGGVVNQRKVVQETNLSKAKVSRVVKDLSERGLIEIERLGRTNKLKLVKKKLKF